MNRGMFKNGNLVEKGERKLLQVYNIYRAKKHVVSF